MEEEFIHLLWILKCNIGVEGFIEGKAASQSRFCRMLTW